MVRRGQKKEEECRSKIMFFFLWWLKFCKKTELYRRICSGSIGVFLQAFPQAVRKRKIWMQMECSRESFSLISKWANVRKWREIEDEENEQEEKTGREKIWCPNVPFPPPDLWSLNTGWSWSRVKVWLTVCVCVCEWCKGLRPGERAKHQCNKAPNYIQWCPLKDGAIIAVWEVRARTQRRSVSV